MELGRELGIERAVAVSNKIRDDLDRQAVASFAESHGLEVIAEIPFDDELRRGDQARTSPLDTSAIAIASIEKLREALFA